jgi:hypothetical protein
MFISQMLTPDTSLNIQARSIRRSTAGIPGLSTTLQLIFLLQITDVWDSSIPKTDFSAHLDSTHRFTGLPTAAQTGFKWDFLSQGLMESVEYP